MIMKNDIEKYFKFNQKEYVYPANKTVVSLFEEKVRELSDTTALVFNNESISYKELNGRVNRVARYLRRFGLDKEEPVVLFTKRNVDTIVGMLAILKVGAAYIPVDPSYPMDRVKYMMRNSNCRIMLTNVDLEYCMRLEDTIVLDMREEKILFGDSSNYDEYIESDNLAYIIYTSGSTGQPKGVMIEHRSIINLKEGINQYIKFQVGKSVLALTTVSFDIFVLETLVPLISGSKVVLANDSQQNNPKLLGELIEKSKIDILQMTPSRLKMLLEYDSDLVCLRNVKDLMLGGETFPKTFLDVFRKNNLSFNIFNVYGPTETTVWSTIKELSSSDEVNIGTTIVNTKAFICDEQNNLVPFGEEGELCLAGEGLARGYFGDEQETSVKFIKPNFCNLSKIYKTGDIARFLPNGDLELIGRKDSQIKIRGYRIELEEIEYVLRKCRNVKDSVVVACNTNNDNVKLIGVITSETEVLISEVQAELNRILPKYMIPQIITQVDQLPLTPNGKLDRRKLINSYNQELNCIKISVDNAREQQSFDIDSRLLEVLKYVGVNLNDAKSLESILGLTISEVGINSVIYIRLIVAIEDKFEIEVEDEKLMVGSFKYIRDIRDYLKEKLEK